MNTSEVAIGKNPDLPKKCTIIGMGGTAEEDGQLTLAANGKNVIEVFADGRMRIFGEEVDYHDPETAAKMNEAMHEFAMGIAKWTSQMTCDLANLTSFVAVMGLQDKFREYCGG